MRDESCAFILALTEGRTASTIDQQLSLPYSKYHCNMSEFLNECHNTTAISSRVTASDDHGAIQATNPKCHIAKLRAIAPKLTQVGAKAVFPTRTKSSLSCGTKHLSDVKVELGDEALWEIFHAEDHEMKIINTGRYVTLRFCDWVLQMRMDLSPYN